MNTADLKERIAVGAPLTPEQRDYLLSILTPPRKFVAGDIVQIDPGYNPDQMGGILFVTDGDTTGGMMSGSFLDWGMRRTGMIGLRVSLSHVRHTGGKIQWPIDHFIMGGGK